MTQLTELNSWLALESHAQSLGLSTQGDFSHNQFKLEWEELILDFSKQRVNETTIELLLKLAQDCRLQSKIEALMQGGKVNLSEDRPALHTALRQFSSQPILVNDQDIIPAIFETREQMGKIAQSLRQGQWLGYSGLPIKDIVNIGIGGSDFGPRFCLQALSPYVTKQLGFHFVSDCDPKAFEQAVEHLDPATTLFILSSKSFTTQETLYNAKKAIQWLNQPSYWDKHFIAVTAYPEKAAALGMKQILPIWEWVGGRYSFCSAINLITCIAIGFEQFQNLLKGANQMDQHYLQADLSKNIPAMLGLLGIWNINFLHHLSLLILVYAKPLELFVPYIQQLDMESNGKSRDQFGEQITHATGPIVWGGLGNQAQHSYYQLLCQGTHQIAADFISLQEYKPELINSFCESKRQVLSEGVHNTTNNNAYIEGGIPLNHISLQSCTPFNIGALTALYEHKIYTQSVLWNINPFDQPGVESAKKNNHFFAKK